MKNAHRYWLLLSLTVAILCVTGCRSDSITPAEPTLPVLTTPEVADEQANSPTLAPSVTPTPTFIPTPTATLIPTSTPIPTQTPIPTPTPTPTEPPIGGGGLIFFQSDRRGRLNFDIFALDPQVNGWFKLAGSEGEDSFPAWSPDGKKILFVSEEEHDLEIYVMNVDGSERTRLTHSPDDDVAPAWSPDGTKIAYASESNFKSSLYVMDADGSNPVALTEPTHIDTFPSWGPDGNRIVFTSNRAGNYDLYIMNADGTNVTQLTSSPRDELLPNWSRTLPDTPEGRIVYVAKTDTGHQQVFTVNPDGSELVQLTFTKDNNTTPAWSSDGQEIAFVSQPDGNPEIYIMSPEGGILRRLTFSEEFEVSPTFSPDGRKIAFASNREGNFDVYVMDAAGPHEIQLTDDPAADINPAVSPDGRQLVFASNRDGDYDIYVIDVATAMNIVPRPSSNDGPLVIPLTQNIDFDGFPAWSPDGRRIAFVSERDGARAIYVMAADGSNITRLTDPAKDIGNPPAWSPDGSQIAFLSSDSWNTASLTRLKIMNSDGSDVRQFEENKGSLVGVPSWFGDLIAVMQYLNGTDGIALILDEEGKLVNQTQQRRINTLLSNRKEKLLFLSSIAWSPDGNYLAYSIDPPGRGNSTEIQLEHLDSGLAIPVAFYPWQQFKNDPIFNMSPFWATNAHLPAPIPPATPDANGYRYLTHFADLDQWYDFQIPFQLTNHFEYEYEAREDGLSIHILKPDTTAYLFYQNNPGTPDVTVSTIVEFAEGTNQDNVSLICRASEDGWYEFRITSTGDWFIYREHDGQWYDGKYYPLALASGTSHEINLWPGKNTLQATCQGTLLVFSINGVELGSVRDYKFREGWVGFSVSSLNIPDITVLIDEFSVK